MDESREIRQALDWQPARARPDEKGPDEMGPDGNEFSDIRYETAEGIAKITIARPEVRNAFRPLTTRELMTAFDAARDDPEVGVVLLTGEGPLAFSSGGDQGVRGDDGYVDEHGIGRLNVLDLRSEEHTSELQSLAYL